MPEQVDSPDDPRVADYVGLTDGARRMRHEAGAGFFIAEGEKVIARTAAAGYPPRSLLVSPQLALAGGSVISGLLFLVSWSVVRRNPPVTASG